MSIQDAYFYGTSSDSYLIGGHSYQCVCVLHAILLPSGYLTLSTIAPYNIDVFKEHDFGVMLYYIKSDNNGFIDYTDKNNRHRV
jgi:hypothetical protein